MTSPALSMSYTPSLPMFMLPAMIATHNAHIEPLAYVLQAMLGMHEDPLLLNGALLSQTEAMSAQQSTSVSSRVPKLDTKTQDMLQKLSELSNSLVQDAKEDDVIFRSGKGIE